MPKTLIVTLGEPEDPRPKPASMASVQVDGACPKDIQALYVELDASEGRAATVSLRRLRVMDGLEWIADEEYVISSMSLIIECEDARVIS
jgi:hypothetical protein